jgi:hypothetical protein
VERPCSCRVRGPLRRRSPPRRPAATGWPSTLNQRPGRRSRGVGVFARDSRASKRPPVTEVVGCDAGVACPRASATLAGSTPGRGRSTDRKNAGRRASGVA